MSTLKIPKKRKLTIDQPAKGFELAVDVGVVWGAEGAVVVGVLLAAAGVDAAGFGSLGFKVQKILAEVHFF